MSQPTGSKFEERVIDAAEAVLKRDRSVGPLELLQEMRLLEYVHVQSWRQGREHFDTLTPYIQGSAEKLQKAFDLFRAWAAGRGLKQVEASYLRSGVRGGETLRVIEGGSEELERFFCTHFAAGNLPEAKARQLSEKLNKAPDLTVFKLASESAECSECGGELLQHAFIALEQGKPVCMACADLDHLVFVPSGDAALSRRSRKYSPLSAVVVEFSRSRKRYERRGILVTSDALAKAEAECAEDAGDRAARQRVEAVRREGQDRELVDAMKRAILEQFPGCPPNEAQQIAVHTAERGSGRVGRSAAGRSLDPKALELAVIASIRHTHTAYDGLLMKGVARAEARQRIRARLDEVLESWRKPGA